jgi:hypothetical protein
LEWSWTSSYYTKIEAGLRYNKAGFHEKSELDRPAETFLSWNLSWSPGERIQFKKAEVQSKYTYCVCWVDWDLDANRGDSPRKKLTFIEQIITVYLGTQKKIRRRRHRATFYMRIWHWHIAKAKTVKNNRFNKSYISCRQRVKCCYNFYKIYDHSLRGLNVMRLEIRTDFKCYPGVWNNWISHTIS